jgi:hypothetical protein
VFVELESVPLNERDNRDFQDAEHRLMQALNLGQESFPGMQSVLNRRTRPCHPPGYVAYTEFFVVRKVRLALLAAIRNNLKKEPAPMLGAPTRDDSAQ